MTIAATRTFLLVFCLSASGMNQAFFHGGLLPGGNNAVQLPHLLSN
ncbi:hypothetical protein [Streptomyces rimosus]|nr:hypothetical protein [Streptomyces rimosus]